MGTASAMPISDRNPSAQVLCVHGHLFLIDCGEGTQQQMRRMKVSFQKIDAIFISHIHGDHVFGLFGLLNSMAMYGRTAELPVYGPAALGSVLKFYSSFFCDRGDFKIRFEAVKCSEPTEIFSNKLMKVSAFPLRHKIECYGYRFDFTGTARNPEAPSYAYCSDTAPEPKLSTWLKGVSTLYHEATYPIEFKQKAELHFHSTTEDAAICAKEAGVKQLLIGHYSSRITDFDAFLRECTDIFPETRALQDLEEVVIK